jgi:hypothetical protein
VALAQQTTGEIRVSEKTEYSWLKENIFRPPNRCERVENLLVFGMPDVNVCLTGGEEFWLEIKSPVEPKRSTTPLLKSQHGVSQEQKNWFLAQRRAGGRAMFWIGTDKRRILLPGVYADVLNTLTVGELLERCVWSGEKGERIDAQEILQCFRT